MLWKRENTEGLSLRVKTDERVVWWLDEVDVSVMAWHQHFVIVNASPCRARVQCVSKSLYWCHFSQCAGAVCCIPVICVGFCQ